MSMPRYGRDKICKICNKTFYASRAREMRGDALKYCSRQCYAIDKRKPRYKKICECCKQEFFVKAYDILRQKGITFCSQKCWHKYCEVDNYYQKERNSLKYKEWRLEVYERDKFTCQECGKKGGNLIAHHLLQVFEYPHLIIDLDNGMTLCRDCHKNKHMKIVKGKYGREGINIRTKEPLKRHFTNVRINSIGTGVEAQGGL